MSIADGIKAFGKVLGSSKAELLTTAKQFGAATWVGGESIVSDIMKNKTSAQLFAHVALGSAIGAGAGLMSSAIGRGLNTVAPVGGFETDSLQKSAFKGAILGAGIATGIGALLHSQGAFKSAFDVGMFASEAAITKPLVTTAKVLSSKWGVGMIGGAAVLGGSGMLLKSIISTSMTKAQEPSGDLGLPPGAAVYDDVLMAALRMGRR
jgi:hypothetical protein